MKKILALTVTVLVTGFAGYNTVSGQTNDNTDTGKKSSAKEKPQHVASSYDDFNSMVASFKEKRRIELKTADKFYAESYYYTAANYYRDVLRQDTSNRYAAFWLAMSLLESRDYENAEVFFRVFYSIKPGEKENTKKWDLEDKVLYNKGEYYFGQVLHRNGKYDEAIEHLNKFAKSYTPSTDKDHPDNFTKLAQLEIAGCEWAKSAPKAKVKIYNAGPGVNKSYNEGGPCGVGEDNLYYSSRKADGHNDTLVFVEGNKAKPIYEIKHSTLENGKWSEGIAVDNKDVNTDGYNVGNGAFNKAMNRFYFTKCTDMDDSRSLCNLYVADYSNGNFSNVTRLPEPINSKEKYTSTQPTVRTSDDGTETVYFVTDRPGGAGGMDIWYFTRMQSGDFRGPDPVKGTLNTVADEMTPYFDDSTKTLYFSSDGQPGLGGFDVFSSAENADLSWSDPVNVGTPVNTGADDLYYSRSNDQTNGFLVSNRVGTTPLNGIKTGGDDIFYWTNFRYAVQGLAFKEADGGGSGGALTGAVFKLYKKMPDGSKVLVSIDSSSATGKAGARGEGSYFFKLSPETDYVVEADRDGFSPKTMDVTTKGLPDEDTLNNNIVIRKAMGTIKGLVAEEGKGTGVEGASVELIEVFPNGLQQTVYYMKSNPYYAFDVEFGKNYKLVTRKEGYFANTTEVSIPASSTDTIRKDISIAKLELNKAYTLQNVLYEFGKSTLTENSKAVLDNLYQIMVENPSFIIELSSHTDGIGSDAGNMKLSQDRAQSCVDYLISKGITKDRLIAKGYGKTRPKVPNTTPDGKDDPAGRAINRRTEFSIVGLKKDQ